MDSKLIGLGAQSFFVSQQTPEQHVNLRPSGRASAYQVLQDFAKTIVNEPDPDRISDLVTKLNRELAEIDRDGRDITEIHFIS